jgi:hypothetical protein
MSSSAQSSAPFNWQQARYAYSTLTIESFRPIVALMEACRKEKDPRRAAHGTYVIYHDISETLLVLVEKMDQYAETQNQLLDLRSDLQLYATDLLRDNKAYFDELVSKAVNKEE